MKNNKITNTLICPVCKENKLEFNSNIVCCSSCNKDFNLKSGGLNLLSEKQSVELEEVMRLNFEDRVDNPDTSNSRQHAEDVYIESGYTDTLFNELKPKKGALIVDLGCGRGHISGYFIDKGFDVLSVDIVEQNIADTKNENKILATMDDLPIADNSFDCIVCTDVLEHIIPNDQNKIISEMYRILKPGGKMLVSFPGNNLPNLTGVHIMNIGIFFIRLFDKRVLYMSWKECPAHINMNYPWSIKKAFSEVGFEGKVVPHTNHFLSLPKKYHKFVYLLNAPIIRNFFIHLMHGVLRKPQ